MARQRKTEGLEVSWTAAGSYPVVMAENMFADGNTVVADLLRRLTGSENPKLFLVADMNVVQRTEGLGSAIGRYVQANGIRLAAAPVVISGGEKVKTDNLQSVMRIASAAVDAKIGVGDVLMAIGGGSVLDVAGYAAAQVRGGVKLVRVPTTPAAMADAAFAHYAAVDCREIKDALRIKSEPAAVVIDFTYARTVLDGVWRGGLGEIVRFAAASDGVLLKKFVRNVEALRNRDMDAFVEVMRDCVSSRARKGDSGFAQWSAQRLEAMSAYKLPHGYAVPLAICIDCAYAVEKGLLTREDANVVTGALVSCGALDGLVHSQHLISQPDNILYGLDAWRLVTGTDEVTLTVAPGVSERFASPDREMYRRVIKEFLTASTSA